MSIGFGYAFFLLFSIKKLENHDFIFVVLLLVCIYTFVSVNINIKAKYIEYFKDLVIEEVIRFINPSLSYSPLSYVSQSIFMDSKLYQSTFTSYNGSEYVSGDIQGTTIKFSNLDVTKGGGKHKSTIFNGVFFCADFNKPFEGETFVLPDLAENIFGELGTFFQSLSKSRGELVKFEDSEFEKLFVIYSSNQASSRYILNPIMQRLIDFRKNVNRKVLISFVHSKIYIALPGYKLNLEPKYFSNIVKFESLVEYFENLQLLIGIVEDLYLNRNVL